MERGRPAAVRAGRGRDRLRAARSRRVPSGWPAADRARHRPGPTDPARVGLVGVVRAAAARRLPTLGDLPRAPGHRPGLRGAARAHAAPAREDVGRDLLGRAPLRGLAGPSTVMRYHSLALAGVGRPLRVVATSEDGVVMAVEHEELPAGRPAVPPRLVRHAARCRDDRVLLPGARVRLADLESLPSFALLGRASADGGGRAAHAICAPASRRAAARLRRVRVARPRRPAPGRRPAAAAWTRSSCRRRRIRGRASRSTGHAAAVAAIREAIAAGDVYQVCLTVRARLAPVTGAALFARMAARGLPRFAAWVRLPGGVEFVSASPELFFEIERRADPLGADEGHGARRTPPGRSPPARRTGRSWP